MTEPNPVAIWITPLTLAAMTELSARTAPERIGLAFTGIGDDWLEGSLPLDERTRGADGTLHHGALAIVAETLGSVGASMCVDMSRRLCLGQVLHLQHAGPVGRGPLRARAVPLWIQAQSQLWEIQIHDDAGARVCVAQLALAVVDRPAVPRA
jgi:1,4-dihydroxy-2-naphthoyl-CoA hydrolase